jgi:hypothetical protein
MPYDDISIYSGSRQKGFELRANEIIELSKEIMQMTGFILALVIAAVVACAQYKDGRVILVAQVTLLVGNVNVSRLRRNLLRNATYMSGVLERNPACPQWEGRLGKFRAQEKTSKWWSMPLMGYGHHSDFAMFLLVGLIVSGTGAITEFTETPAAAHTAMLVIEIVLFLALLLISFSNVWALDDFARNAARFWDKVVPEQKPGASETPPQDESTG